MAENAAHDQDRDDDWKRVLDAERVANHGVAEAEQLIERVGEQLEAGRTIEEVVAELLPHYRRPLDSLLVRIRNRIVNRW